MSALTINKMSFETWNRKFQPIKNHLSAHTAINGTVYLKSGDNGDFIMAQNPENVWSFVVVDGVREATWLISNGIHSVNVMGYIVTRRPADADVDYEIIY
ncbi:MAG: hypothetical protein EXR27_06445 [Betaproteobacteria bacterium]|nr:hypothetical protein [Betaproteobacteria bacterium]